MPDATITSTASTFGTISGVFSADQSTISGTISGIVPGTLTGSVGVPGPAGPGVPAGGTSGQFLQKTSGVDYATDWVTVNLAGLATESWVTAGFYPLSGNPSGFLTAASLSGYATESFVTSQGYITSAALSPYITSATATASFYPLSGNPSGFLTSAPVTSVAGRTGAITLSNTDISGLGSLAVVNDAPSDGSQYARKNGAWDVVTTTPDFISSVSSPLSVTTGNLTVDLSAYAPLASPVFTGDARAVTPAFGDNDTSIATTAFVQAGLLGGTANARNLEVEVRNQSGSTIAAGSIVYISGATGNKPLITLAQANNDANSAQTIGFVKTAIANNGTGYVIVRGELENIDTSALTEGVQLYLSPTVAGSWTTTKPSAPQHLVYVGIVIRSHPTLGTILVAVQNGYELDELHDVAIASKANNDLLAYESSTDLWKNKTFSALGLLTSADAAATYFTIASAAGKANLSGATFTNDILVSSSPDTTNIGAGILGMYSSANSYSLTLSTAAGYPQIFFNGPTGTSTQTVAYPGPSGFLLKADNLSGLANTGTARTNLGLGTMATATASDYSTTTVANGLYYPLSSNPAGYLTSAPVTSVAGRTGAITLAVADVSGAAPLASPTFTGTPSLPTGTIGVTQTAGNNTTALATTAFVTAAVPAFATTAEINSPASTTKAITPFDAVRMITNRAFFDTKAATGSFNTSGTGAEAYKVTNDRLLALGTPNAGIAGHGQNMFDTTASSWGLLAAKRGAFHYTQDWSKKIFASGTTMFNLIGDSATTARVMIGGKAAFGAGSPTKQSIGWKLVGGGSNALVLVTYGYNGTSSVVTETTSSFTPVVNQAFDWFLYHEPNVSTPSLSKCYLYVNDNLVATGQNSPADATITFNYFLQGCESTGSHATRMAYYAFPTKIWWSRS
jgi:hypothetical protein